MKSDDPELEGKYVAKKFKGFLNEMFFQTALNARAKIRQKRNARLANVESNSSNRVFRVTFGFLSIVQYLFMAVFVFSLIVLCGIVIIYILGLVLGGAHP